MFRFLQRFGRDSQARGRGTGPLNRVRRRNHQLKCEDLESRQLLSGYYIINASSLDALDDPGGSTSNFTIIDQWVLNGGANQRWDLVPVGNGNYFIQNEASQFVLDNALSTNDGSVIYQTQSYGGPNQQWQLVQQPNGTDLIVNAYSQKALEDPPGAQNGDGLNSEGIQMVQSQVNGGDNQQWTLVAAGDGPADSDYIQNAYYGNYVDVADTPSQFNFVPLADGNDLIVGNGDGASGVISAEDGQGVFDLLSFVPSQQWYIAQQGNGTVAMVNAESYMVIDENAGPGSLGLDQWYDGPTQEFYWQALRLASIFTASRAMPWSTSRSARRSQWPSWTRRAIRSPPITPSSLRCRLRAGPRAPNCWERRPSVQSTAWRTSRTSV
jgi:Ricin-type beta-trefoil lectin domain-like